MIVPLYMNADDGRVFELNERKDVLAVQESVKVVARYLIVNFAQHGNFRDTLPNINIDGRDTAHIFYATLLCVTISQDIVWNKQVEHIVKKA